MKNITRLLRAASSNIFFSGIVIIFFAGIVISIVNIVFIDADVVETPDPVYQVGQHVIFAISKDEAIITRKNGYSTDKGWTMKATLLDTGVEIPVVHEDLLLPVR